MVDALRRASAATINVVIPYYAMLAKTEKRVPESQLRPNWLLTCCKPMELLEW